MSGRVAPTKDTLVCRLTAAEEADRKTHTPKVRDLKRAHPVVRLWGLPGLWAVWSPGPERDTWWLQPRDADAINLASELRVKPDRGQPIVVNIAQGCIAVHTYDVRTGGDR